MPLPPLAEQAAIATFLDRETAKIDALVDEQRRLIELLKEKRQAVISHAVTKGLNPDAPMKDSGVEWLGEVPEHWDCQRIEAHLASTVGIASTRATYDRLKDCRSSMGDISSEVHSTGARPGSTRDTATEIHRLRTRAGRPAVSVSVASCRAVRLWFPLSATVGRLHAS